MAEIDRLIEALKRADEAGDKEGATFLANEIRKRQQGETTFRRFAAGTSRGAAKAVGAPVDLVSGVLKAVGISEPETEPLGGSQSIQRGLAAIGLGVPPEEDLGMAGTVGDVTGQAAAAAPALVAGGIRSIANADLIENVGIATTFIRDVAKTAVNNPISFFTFEAASGAAAGAARSIAEERFPDSQGAQAFAEILGGVTPAAAVSGARLTGRGVSLGIDRIPLLGPRVIASMRKQFRNFFTTTGAMKRGSRRFGRATQTPEQALKNLDRDDILEGSGLTAAQRSEDEGLLSLERAVAESTEELTNARAAQFTETNQVIRQSLGTLPSQEQVPIHQTKGYLSSLLDERLRIAQAHMDDRLQALGQTATREDANRIAREELNKALRAARDQESELFANIDEAAKAPTLASQEALESIRVSLGKAQQGDIPAIAKKFLNPGNKKSPNPNFLGDDTSVKELRSLQSKLREEARIARSDKKFNRARIADSIANSITDDISNAVGEAGSDVAKDVDIAVSFSRDLNARFTQGTVGRLLGTDRAGGAAIDPSLTLEVTVGKRGPRAKVETDALLNAVQRSGDEPAMRGHIQGYLVDDFRRHAVKNGAVDRTAGTTWMEQNQDVLGRFPELRRDIESAVRAGGEVADLNRLANPEISAAAVFINAAPGKEIARIVSLSNPRQAMRDIVDVVRQDPTGRALKGVKQAFSEYIMRRSQLTSQVDLRDAPFISGSKMEEVLTDPGVAEAMKGLFTPSEMRRFQKIQNTALLLERARKTGLPDEGIIADEPGLISSLLARIGGAQIGRVLASNTGGGTVQTPGILSAYLNNLLKAGVRDPASQLLSDAMQNETLFRALLIDPAESPKAARAVRVRLNAWAMDLLREQNQTDAEDE